MTVTRVRFTVTEDNQLFKNLSLLTNTERNIWIYKGYVQLELGSKCIFFPNSFLYWFSILGACYFIILALQHKENPLDVVWSSSIKYQWLKESTLLLKMQGIGWLDLTKLQRWMENSIINCLYNLVLQLYEYFLYSFICS